MTEDPVSTVAMIKTLSTHIADSALAAEAGGAADLGKFEKRDPDEHCGAGRDWAKRT